MMLTTELIGLLFLTGGATVGSTIFVIDRVGRVMDELAQQKLQIVRLEERIQDIGQELMRNEKRLDRHRRCISSLQSFLHSKGLNYQIREEDESQLS